MKQLFWIVILLAFVFACNTQKSVLNVTKSNESAATDSTEYEMETFDNKFKNWYQYYKKPSLYKSQEYYESWNRQYVSAWNAKCAHPGKNWHFEPVVGYHAGEDYGFELNHELFYYFMYVENVLNIPIIPGGPKNYGPEP